jgi:hypothetical protein
MTDSHHRPNYGPMFDYNNILKILVGPEKVPFSIHKDQLNLRSTYFNAIFHNRRWLDSHEAKEGFLPPLWDVDPGLFRIYVHLVYTGELSSELYWGFDSFPKPEHDFKVYCETFFLADQFGDYDGCNAVLRSMIERLSDWPKLHSTQISKIWARTDSESQLRDFILFWMVNSWSRDYITEMVKEGDLPDEFIREALPIALSLAPPMSDSECKKNLTDVLL